MLLNKVTQNKYVTLRLFAWYHLPQLCLKQSYNLNPHLSTPTTCSFLTNNFDFLHEIHNHDARTSALYCVKLPISRTLVYGIHSVKCQSARSWNYLQANCSASNLYISKS